MKSHASMNRIYRLVFNAALGIWVAVAENARGKGKGGRAASALLATVSLLAILSPAAYAANAADATLRGGTGTVATVGTTTTIHQTSQRLAIDWTQLSTAAGEALNFNQPNAQAIALNRITGSNPSQFLGSLSANGQVFILNPNGILFGAGSQVNVGGIVASTLEMNSTDFMRGSNVFTKTTGTGSVVNQGSMTAAQGGYLALLAPEVRNEGVMTATLGTALLAAGNKVTLNLSNGSLLSYSIDQGAINALAENKQLIQADGGQVLLSAKALHALTTATVNNTGVIEAKTIQNIAGRVMLMGDMEYGTVNVDGRIDASAQNGGNGGFVETSAANVKVADSFKYNALASNGQHGTWLIDPLDFTIRANSDPRSTTGIGANTLSTNLNGGNIAIATVAGAGNGDIFVRGSVSWNAATTLTLTADRNIDFNDTTTRRFIESQATGSAVVLNAGVAILGRAAGDSRISADSVSLNAATGIGSASAALLINTNTLSAQNSGAGGITLNVNQFGNLSGSAVNTINIDQLTTASGDIKLNVLRGHLLSDVNRIQTGNGNVNITTASGVTGGAGAGDITIGQGITATGGSISLATGNGSGGGDALTLTNVNGTAGERGGNIRIDNTALVAGNAISLASGTGGRGGDVNQSQAPGSAAQGGNGAAGGRVDVESEGLSAGAGGISLTAGNGGRGGDGFGSTVGGSESGTGGAGGVIVFTASSMVAGSGGGISLGAGIGGSRSPNSSALRIAAGLGGGQGSSGSITLGQTGSGVLVQAGGNVAFDQNVTMLAANAAVRAGATTDAGGNTTYTAGNTITQTNGNVAVGSGAALTTSAQGLVNTLDVTGSGSLVLDGVTGNVTTTKAINMTGGTARLQGGSVTINEAAPSITANRVELVAANDITGTSDGSAVRINASELALQAGGNITGSSGQAFVTGVGAVTAVAGGNVVLSTTAPNATVAARATGATSAITVKAADGTGAGITVGSLAAADGTALAGITATGNVAVTAGSGAVGGAGGSVTVNAGVASTTGAVALTGGAGATGQNGGAVNSGMAVGQSITAATTLSLNGGAAGAGGSQGTLGGSNLAASAGTSLSVNTSAVNLSGNLSLSAPTLSLPATTLNANSVALSAANGLGTTAAPLQINAGTVALVNTGSGGVYVNLLKNTTIGALSNNGDLVITGANGADAPNLSTRSGVGVRISADTAVARAGGGTMLGLTTTGSGNISVVAGKGGNGISSGTGIWRDGNYGEAGGALSVSNVSASGSVTLQAGNGGAGGNNTATTGSLTVAPAGTGGNLTLGSTPVSTTGTGVAFSAGTGGAGGSSTNGTGGPGGQGGRLVLNGSTQLAFTGNAVLGAGLGGAGGSGAGGTVGANGSTGLITGSNIDISATGNLTLTAQVLPSSGASRISLRAGVVTLDDYAAGTLGSISGALTLAQSSLLADPTQASRVVLQGGRIVTTTASGDLAGFGVNANTVQITTASAIGTVAAPLSALAQNIALRNVASGDIRLSRSNISTLQSFNLAASAAAGSVVVNSQDGPNAANITVDTVAGLAGVTARGTGTGQGNISLTAGNRDSGGARVDVNAALRADRDVTLTAGNATGSSGETGGSALVKAPITAGGTIRITTGNGVGTGAGGFLRINAALSSAGDVELTSGAASAAGGTGGAIQIDSSPSSVRNLLVQAGDGGGSTGAGGRVGVAASLAASQRLSLRTGQNQAGDRGQINFNNSGAFALSAGGPLELLGALDRSDPSRPLDLSLSAGTGISNGAGGAVVATDVPNLSLANSTSGSVLVNAGNANVRVAASGIRSDVTHIATAGNITLDGSITATGTGDAVRLAGARFVNNSGASPIDSGAGRYIVWSSAPINNTFGGMQSGQDAIWNTVYNSASPNLLPAQTGNRFVFGAPQLTGVAVVRANDASKTYGDAYAGNPGVTAFAWDSGAAYGGAFTGGSAAAVNLTGTASYTTAGSAATANAGVYDITTSGLSLAVGSPFTSMVYGPGMFTVNQRAINITGSRVYDGSTAVAASALTAGNTVNSDAITLTGAGSMADKHAGNGKVLGLGTLALGGSAAANYTLAGGAATANITQRRVTLTGMTTADRQYDGSTLASLTGGVIATGVAGEALTFANATGQFDNANAGSRAVTVTGTTLANGAGGLATNYVLTGQPTVTNATIAQRQVTLTGITAAGRQYDGTRVASLSGGSIATGVAGQALTFSGAAGQFASANAGSHAVAVTGTALANGAGGLASNYVLTGQPTVANATIAPKTLTLSSPGVVARQYNGTAIAQVTGFLTGFVGSQTLTSSGFTGTFASANAGTHAVTMNAPVMGNGSGLASNYQVAAVTLPNATIAQRQVTLTGITAAGKDYDGTQLASLTGGSIATGVTGEALGFTGATGQFVSANAGSRAVTVTGATLADGAGGLASNYVLAAQPTVANATVAQRQVTLTGMTAAGKDYDGTLLAALSGGALNNVVNGEALAFSGATGQFASANAGGQAVAVTGTTLANGAGGLASNYVLTGQPLVANATIAQRQVTLTGMTATDRIYDGTRVATLSGGALNNLVTGETLTVNGTTGQFASRNAGSQAVTVAGTTLANGVGGAGGLASNYLLTSQPTVANATITQRALTVTATAQNKVYNGSAAASVTYADNRIMGDALSLTSSASFHTKDAGTGKLVTASGIMLSGGDAGNYSANTTATTHADITRAPLSVTANSDSKDLGGAAYAGGNGVQLTGLVAGETMANLGGTLTYGGTAQGAKGSGSYSIAPGGLTANNYAVTYADGTLTIRPADAVTTALGGPELAAAYRAAVQSTRPADKQSNKAGFETSPTQMLGCGMLMPAGFDTAQCN